MKRRSGQDYMGEMRHKGSIMHCAQGSKITADIYFACDDPVVKWRLAIAACSGKYQELQGKYFFCRTRKELSEKWDEIISDAR